MKINKNSKFAFTMVEIVFVIIIIGILASIGSSFLPDNRLLNDTNFLVMKIKEKQKNAIGNDIVGFGAPWSVEDNSTCIDFNKTKLEDEDKNSERPYKFSSTISVVNNSNSTVCFDELGRPYQANALLFQRFDIKILQKSNEFKTVSVEPMSGYVTIKN